MPNLGLCAFADAFNLTPEQLTEHNVNSLYRCAHFSSKSDNIFGKKIMAFDNAVKERLKRAQDAVCE
ncbi:unnamed protein product [Protopolystoma xenopodis]|uniref:Uncharacterized protein n=1 Tax=Protopolystoma xenopodis TaxID=117903 RepID=A0A448XPN5_9PLAT|nr:unnamed protein product [Protopolystoma xenopodis]